MDLDPRNYDLGELRGPSAERDSDGDRSESTEASDQGAAGFTLGTPSAPNDGSADTRSNEGDDGTEGRESASRNGERAAPDERDFEPSSHGTSPPAGTPPTRAPVGETTDRYRRLVAIERTFEDDPEKPYLTTLPTAFSDEVVVFEWLTALLSQAGHRDTVRALRYYREIGWITEGVETTLRGYLGGFDAGEGTRPLTPSDHLDSLLAIARLASTRRNE